MNVHVNAIRRYVEKQRHHRVTVAREKILIGAPYGADQQPVLHRAAVDKQILGAGIAAVQGRSTGLPAAPDAAALGRYGDRIIGEFPAHTR